MSQSNVTSFYHLGSLYFSLQGAVRSGRNMLLKVMFASDGCNRMNSHHRLYTAIHLTLLFGRGYCAF